MNLNKMGGMDKLTDSERYWVGYLNRLAEKEGWTVTDELPLSSSVYLDFSRKREIDRPEKLHKVALSSDLCASLRILRSASRVELWAWEQSS